MKEEQVPRLGAWSRLAMFKDQQSSCYEQSGMSKGPRVEERVGEKGVGEEAEARSCRALGATVRTLDLTLGEIISHWMALSRSGTI